MKHERGFSLIELLVTIALMSILTAIAIPALLSVRPAWNVNSTARGIMMDMQLARVKAISKNRQHWVRFGYPAANQYSIWEDTNANGTWQTPGDSLIMTVDLPSGIQFGSAGGIAGPGGSAIDADGINFGLDNAVSFKRTGEADTGTVYLVPTEDVANNRTDRIRAVRILYGVTGYIKAYKYTGSAWTDF